MDNILKIDVLAPMNSRNNAKDEDYVVFGAEAYIDSAVVSGIKFPLNDMTGLAYLSVSDSLRPCFIMPESYVKIDVPYIISYVAYRNKNYTVKSGTITFWVGRTWGGSDPRWRSWSIKKCKFECVAEAADGEEIVLTEGFL